MKKIVAFILRSCCLAGVCFPAASIPVSADVMVNVSTLNGETGGSMGGDSDSGLLSASASFSGSVGGSSFSGLGTAGRAIFSDGILRFDSFRFRSRARAENSVGIGGGPEAFEVGSEITWADTLTGFSSGDLSFPAAAFLDFEVHGLVSITDHSTVLAGGTVAFDLQVSGDDGSGKLSGAGLYATNTDNDATTEFAPSGTWSSLTTSGTREFTGRYRMPVSTGTPFLFSLRSLAVIGYDGLVDGDLTQTVSLVGVTDSGGKLLNNAAFGSGGTFSAAAVPEPLTFPLIMTGTCGAWLLKRRRAGKFASPKR